MASIFIRSLFMLVLVLAITSPSSQSRITLPNTSPTPSPSPSPSPSQYQTWPSITEPPTSFPGAPLMAPSYAPSSDVFPTETCMNLNGMSECRSYIRGFGILLPKSKCCGAVRNLMGIDDIATANCLCEGLKQFLPRSDSMLSDIILSLKVTDLMCDCGGYEVPLQFKCQ